MPAPELWEGGREPFKASYGKLMMWYFLISDAFTFSGFLIAYGALRFSTPTYHCQILFFLLSLEVYTISH
jgi:cytochrome c oxidase subunit 3